MKRLTAFFVLFLTALCFALTASAAGDAIHSVTIDGNAVKVSVTAQSDCALFVGLYDKDGRLLSVQTRDVAAATGRAVSVSIPGGIPAGSSAKAFLTGADNKPLCKSNASGDASATDSDVYAILYSDGTMVFQHGDTPQAGREVKDVYVVDMTGSYEYYEESGIPSTPWYDAKSSIKQVEFADVIQPKSTAYWFCDCTELNEIRNIENLDTSRVTSMPYMFYRCLALTTLDLSSFDTSNVTDMSGIFSRCVGLEALDLASFGTSNVTNMNGMFSHCYSLKTLDMSKFNTSNVTDMCFMFQECRSLTALNLSNFDTSNVTDMCWMFDGCWSLTSLDVHAFDTSNVTTMEGMFEGCIELTSLDVSNFDTSKVTTMWNMFDNCRKLTALDLSNFDTSDVTNMEGMFDGCMKLTSLDVSSFDTSKVTTMWNMFNYCQNLEILDLSNFNTSNVTLMYSMFYACSKLSVIYVSDKFVTNQVKASAMMFYNCFSLVGEEGTIYNAYRSDVRYARIDGGPSNPGYFTAK